MGNLDVVVGAQFGSESKGHLTADLAKRYLDEGREVFAVRVAGHNAGHTAYDSQGRAWALRTVPAAAVVDNRIKLVIAAGSEVDPRVLRSEVDELEAAGIPVSNRLFVDGSATWLEQDHINQEQEAQMHEKSGSTAKGVGAARAARIMRVARTIEDYAKLCYDLDDTETSGWVGFNLSHTGPMLRFVLGEPNTAILIEGTQGYGLGVHTDHYPLTTSSDCRAIDFLAMAGIDPTAADDYKVWLATRPNPIRVAGPSGELKGETTFADLGQAEEFTTVTKKLRRVGEWDPELVKEAIEANGGPRVVRIGMSMVDKIFPGASNAESVEDLPTEARLWLTEREDELGVEIDWIGTGPDSHLFRPSQPKEHPFNALLRTMLQDVDRSCACGCEDELAEKTLSEFWREKTEALISLCAPKVEEYGSQDLADIGWDLLEMSNKDENASEEDAYETGVYFYVRGKIARWANAIKQGRPVSQDTLDDIITYCILALHNREVGN